MTDNKMPKRIWVTEDLNGHDCVGLYTRGNDDQVPYISEDIVAPLLDQMRISAQHFKHYEALHRAKPDHEKADRNAHYAADLYAAISAYEALINESGEVIDRTP